MRPERVEGGALSLSKGHASTSAVLSLSKGSARQLSLVGDAHPMTDAAVLIGPVTQLRVCSTYDRRNRWVSVIPDRGSGLIVVAQLDRSRSWRGRVRLVDDKVRRYSAVVNCDDTQSAAGRDRRADRPQVSRVREPRALQVRCTWPQHPSESHPHRGRQQTVAARVADNKAAVGRMPGSVEQRMHLRCLVAPR